MKTNVIPKNTQNIPKFLFKDCAFAISSFCPGFSICIFDFHKCDRVNPITISAK
jgi:hypothetical protein